MTLFATHKSYGFSLKPQSFTRCLVNHSQNSHAAFMVPYRAFNSSMYNTFSPHFSTSHGSYISLSISISLFTISPVNQTCTKSGMSACMNAPGTCTVFTTLASFTSMCSVRNTVSVDTVGDVDSWCGTFACCFLPLVQPHALIQPLHLCFRNMR